jgi:serine/threonine-protein kinase RsbW
VTADQLLLRIAADLAGFESGRRAMRAFLEPRGVSERALYRAELAFEEICVNVIRHGLAQQELPGRRIDVEVRCTGEELVLILEDDGPPFDPTQLQPGPPAASLEEARIGGHGISLARQAARDMQYARIAGRNRLTLLLDRH